MSMESEVTYPLHKTRCVAAKVLMQSLETKIEKHGNILRQKRGLRVDRVASWSVPALDEKLYGSFAWIYLI